MISDADRIEVEKAIAEAERNTSGEIVAVIAPASGGYYYVPYMWSALLGLIVPWPLIYWTWMPVQQIYLIQLAVFIALALILHYPPLRYFLVPGAIARQHAHQRAMQQFVAQDIYTAPGHTGVLLFISIAERYAEIVADAAIHAKVPDDEWKGIIKRLTADIGNGNAGKGLVSAISRIGDHLAAHYPSSNRPQNYLPNHLVILNVE